MLNSNKRIKTTPSRRELSDFERGDIVWLSKADHTPTDIANRMNIPRTTVFDTIKRWETTGTAKTKTRPGKPKKINVTDVTSLCLNLRRNPFESYGYHQANLGTAGVNVCRQTVIRYLRAKGFGSYTPVSKPKLTRQQKKTQRGERYQESHTLTKEKYGKGSVMVWGCFSAGGIGPLSFIEESVYHAAYVNCQSKNFNPCYKQLNEKHDTMFTPQEDGASCHTGSYTMWWKKHWEIKRFDYWPSQSTNLNPIEHAWHALKVRILQEWGLLDAEVL
ncbi:Homeodomain-like DNA binding domain-containing transcription factor [Phycomyces blakesleeanus NRRL 1555(-)]|uniref:Homeodomain-like DNA binding domain-containing transcription factor n=1 Tax=Phycomyces blakesleeanus (strain ATCC 8743b / DSM 1359 / FGSC 10004 / NBRC 33097 / NRRL 1555) TaxID=763407 RepID=A0A167LA62_PHYB8|nr:Homeodomain-like DNA binding domain-containing transcription factor [Phycomyces blakesleeanus NRRL 1555(-)]OAD69955.1 Homeodomain-like DNA binding domain-containing transcription factor [Phycomyces blakesleeanus NRRL 1555(-)]|eukprot:XP_018287995.1 Homeodomain-like DNA binding domain-containing transcription factor [Phycomyces blakesleeanus NRRL 1555(-)]